MKSPAAPREERFVWSRRWLATTLTDIIPEPVQIAISRSTQIPALRPAMTVHVFAKSTFDLGREEINIGEGFKVGLYCAERSLVDVIRPRHREGANIAWEALRRWLRRRRAKPSTQIEIAGQFHGAERAVRRLASAQTQSARPNTSNVSSSSFPPATRPLLRAAFDALCGARASPLQLQM